MAKNIYIFFLKFQIDSKGLETHSLRRKANARNVSFETLYRGQFTLSSHLIKPNKKGLGSCRMEHASNFYYRNNFQQAWMEMIILLRNVFDNTLTMFSLIKLPIPSISFIVFSFGVY